MRESRFEFEYWEKMQNFSVGALDELAIKKCKKIM
jgi:hypothetical protein